MNLPERPRDWTALSGVLTTIREKNATVPFLEPEEANELNKLVTALVHTGGTTETERRIVVFLQSIQAKISTGLADFTTDEQEALSRAIEQPTTQTQPRARTVPGWRGRSWARGFVDHPGRVIASLIALVALILAVTILPHVISNLTAAAKPPTSGQNGLPPVANHPVTKTDLQQTLSLFGPWQTIAPSDARPGTNRPAVLMLKQDGSTIASKRWTVPFEPSTWQQQASLNISQLTVQGSFVTIASDQQQTFSVAVGQPFIFEQTPGRLVVVDTSGTVWTLNEAQGISLRHALPH